jgi:hypothetical protein
MASAGADGCASKRGPVEGALSPPARAIRVDADKVVIEGRWQPVASASDSPAPENAVRAVCTRVEKRCREELTTVAGGGSPATEIFEYRIREWTKAKLVATRRSGAYEQTLRVSLTGLAAEKIVDRRTG